MVVMANEGAEGPRERAGDLGDTQVGDINAKESAFIALFRN